MKYLLTNFLVLLVTATVTFAQDAPKEDQKMLITNNYCGPFKEVFETPKKYKEGMLFSGDGGVFEFRSGRYFKGGMFFFVNQETGSWSLINVFSDGMACMIQAGTNFSPYLGRDPWDKIQEKIEEDKS
mgnify:CR=1 FL=1|tara:strand:- start:117 stop:500 length:384 start_codon:yes stop_codon:yes gene_type:complete